MGDNCCTDYFNSTSITSYRIRRVANNDFFKHIIATVSGSVLATLTLNPIHVIKIRMQNHIPTTLHNEKRASIRSILGDIISEKGIRGLWLGSRTGLLMSVPNTVIYMSAYEIIKSSINQKGSNYSRNFSAGIAGCLARSLAVTMITPLELVRTIQTNGKNESVVTIVRDLVRESGISGLYRGLIPTLLRDCPFSAIYWFSFEAFRPIFDQTNSNHPNQRVLNDNYSSLTNFLSAASAGAVSACLTHPFDVLKTQTELLSKQSIQSVVSNGDNSAFGINYGSSSSSNNNNSSACNNAVHQTKKKFHTTGRRNICCNTSYHRSINRPSSPSQLLQIFWQQFGSFSSKPQISLISIYRTGGVNALYRGLIPRIATVVPSSALMVTTYHMIKSINF